MLLPTGLSCDSILGSIRTGHAFRQFSTLFLFEQHFQIQRLKNPIEVTNCWAKPNGLLERGLLDIAFAVLSQKCNDFDVRSSQTPVRSTCVRLWSHHKGNIFQEIAQHPTWAVTFAPATRNHSCKMSSGYTSMP